MTWCPFAIHKPLSENRTQGTITPRAVILHTAVSGAASLFDYFENRSDLESHFYVRDDGTIEQYLDTTRRGDANRNANSFAVSIETQDNGKIVPWTPAQLDALVKLVDWLCTVHSIPRVQIPTADGAGIGWHVMFGAPGPWTPVAKSCPGAPRIGQTRTTIIPRVAAGLTEGDELNTAQDTALSQSWGVLKSGKDWEGSNLQKQLGFVMDQMRAGQAAIVAALAADDVDAEALAARLEAAAREAAAEGAEQAIVTTVLPALREVLSEALSDDNRDQADAIVDQLADRLRGAVPGTVS